MKPFAKSVEIKPWGPHNEGYSGYKITIETQRGEIVMTANNFVDAKIIELIADASKKLSSDELLLHFKKIASCE